MEIWYRIIWKHFESGVPHGHENLFVWNCVCLRLHFLYLCVSCVCSVLSPGTSAMPPLSQFLTSLLKNMLIQTNLPFLLSSPYFSWDGLEETDVHHSQPGCLISHFPSFFLYFTIPNHLFPQQAAWEMMRKHGGHFLCVTLLHCKCRLLGENHHCYSTWW